MLFFFIKIWSICSLFLVKYWLDLSKAVNRTCTIYNIAATQSEHNWKQQCTSFDTNCALEHLDHMYSSCMFLVKSRALLFMCTVLVDTPCSDKFSIKVKNAAHVFDVTFCRSTCAVLFVEWWHLCIACCTSRKTPCKMMGCSGSNLKHFEQHYLCTICTLCTTAAE